MTEGLPAGISRPKSSTSTRESLPRADGHGFRPLQGIEGCNAKVINDGGCSSGAAAAARAPAARAQSVERPLGGGREAAPAAARAAQRGTAPWNAPPDRCPPSARPRTRLHTHNPRRISRCLDLLDIGSQSTAVLFAGFMALGDGRGYGALGKTSCAHRCRRRRSSPSGSATWCCAPGRSQKYGAPRESPPSLQRHTYHRPRQARLTQ